MSSKPARGALIVVLNRKGGVGKTLVATSLSHYLSLRPKQTLFFDLDSSGLGSALVVRAHRVDEMLGVGVGWLEPGEDLMTRIDAELHRHQYVVVDTKADASHDDEIASLCYEAADLILIPFEPSSIMIEGSLQSLQLLRNSHLNNPALRVLFVPTRMRRTKEKAANLAVLKQILDAPDLRGFCKLLTPGLHERTAYQEDHARSTTTMSRAKSDPSRREIEQLGQSVLRNITQRGNDRGRHP